MTHMRVPTASLFVLLAATRASAQAPRPPRTASTQTAISADDLRSRLYLIADDSMMGRQPGEAGNYKAAEYVASEFKRLTGHGVAFTTEPTPAGPITLAVFADTCGNLIQIYQRA